MSDTTKPYSLDNMNNIFKIPICYNKQVKQLSDSVVTDLELLKSIDNKESSIYDNIFTPSNKPSNKIIEQVALHYTTDIDYLKETQTLIKSINSDEINTIRNKHGFSEFELNNMVSLWEEIKGETGFCEKFLFIDWSFAKELNNNPSFLQLMSIYNIASPIISLCLPIFVLIIPFLVIKIRGIELNIIQYIDILKTLISNNAIFKIFTQFHLVDNSQKAYLVFSSAFYLFSIYQNILVCIRFYSNMQKIHNYIFKMRKYIAYTLDIIDYHSSKTIQLTNYNEFNQHLNSNSLVLRNLHNELNNISPFSFSFSKIGEIGHIMCMFYKLYDDQVYANVLTYSFGFNGYFNIISLLNTNIIDNKMTQTDFHNKPNKPNKPNKANKANKANKPNKANKANKPIFRKMYYPKFINENKDSIVTNDLNLNKNIIITGPNASGKTTILKTALINIIISQQFGFGCFESLKLSPYDNIHCYLNIPDTSGRDSLFQAEARRCKDIIDCVNEYPDKTHFCIFDELYSGTNPEEAIVSAFAFMNYIVKNTNITCILTTHYIKLCKKLSKNKTIKNYNMKTIKTNDSFEYTYLICDGISNIKGGLKVLKDMNYPKEMLQDNNI